jgi:lipoprotein-anchoring transpeptidase ErfK/SrfK
MFDRRRFLFSGSAAALMAPLAAPALARVANVDRVYERTEVSVKPGFRPGTIHIDLGWKLLYFITGPEQAIRYGVAVGEEGRNLRGTATVGRKAEWPSWAPTANMIRREPEIYGPLRGGMPGGPDNPLGARALYLYRGGRDTRYRIHGTPQPWTIGMAVSSGCIRMLNEHVTELYDLVPIGAQVTIHHPPPEPAQQVARRG